MNLRQIAYNLQDIKHAAAQLWDWGKEYTVWSFAGDMGAGKTTLISALCHHLGVQDPVSSPTYAIVNEYRFLQEGQQKTIYHADWYRLKNTDEARQAGMEEILYQQDAYTFIEWASRAPELLRQAYLKIEIEVISETERIAHIWA